MTLHLTPEQTVLWREGNWFAYEVEETILEDVERLRIAEPVAVLSPEGTVLFAISGKGVER